MSDVIRCDRCQRVLPRELIEQSGTFNLCKDVADCNFNTDCQGGGTMSEKCAKDEPQCGRCAHNWWNLNAVDETGWCYMFRCKQPACNQFVSVDSRPRKTSVDANMMIEDLFQKAVRIEQLERELTAAKREIERLKKQVCWQ